MTLTHLESRGGYYLLSSVQFSPSTDWVIGDTKRTCYSVKLPPPTSTSVILVAGLRPDSRIEIEPYSQIARSVNSWERQGETGLIDWFLNGNAQSTVNVISGQTASHQVTSLDNCLRHTSFYAWRFGEEMKPKAPGTSNFRCNAWQQAKQAKLSLTSCSRRHRGVRDGGTTLR